MAGKLGKELKGFRNDAPVHIDPGSVVSVQVGGAPDGQDLISVSWKGDIYKMGWLVPYTATIKPAAGHNILIMVEDGQPIIMGRVVGSPAEV